MRNPIRWIEGSKQKKSELLLHVVSSWLANATGECYVSKHQNSSSVENSPIHKKCPKTAQKAVDACNYSCEKQLFALNHSVIVSDTSPVDNPFKRVTGENFPREVGPWVGMMETMSDRLAAMYYSTRNEFNVRLILNCTFILYSGWKKNRNTYYNTERHCPNRNWFQTQTTPYPPPPTPIF